MKKIISIVLTLTIVLVAIPLYAIPVSAATSGTTGECTWALDGTVLTISGNGAMGDYTTYGESPWGTVITEVIIKNGVTNIGDDAFYDCSSLTSVTIPDSVTNIGGGAFAGCKSLTSVTIGDSVTNIGNAAFSNCPSLTSIAIPDSVTHIGFNTFCYCSKLTSVIIGDSVICIDTGAFYNCSKLTTITIPDSVTNIGSHAFHNCTSLKKVFYRGSGSDKTKITITSDNTNLTSATWHYNSCIGNAEHTYDNACDTTCNVCGNFRSILHAYDNACDTTCNVCGNFRSTTHIYDNICDSECNICYKIRTAPHLYDNTCDTTCNECGLERAVPDHIYDNACDTICNVCGLERVVPNHIYDNACDTTCNECQLEREVPDHVYDNACDETCNVCGEKRQSKHIFVKIGENTATCKNCNLSKTFDFIITTDETITLSYEASKEFDFAIEHTSIAKITNVSSSIVSMGSYYRQSSSAKVLSVFPGETVVKIVATNGRVLTSSSLLVVEGQHQMQFSKVLEEATCTEPGKELHICKFCDCEEEKNIPSLGHTEVIDEAVAPTCTKTGLTEGKHCSVCNAVLVSQEVIPETGKHIWNDGRVDSEGNIHYECDTCDAIRTKELLSIAVTKLPDKLSYIAGEHDITYEGMEITAYYDDGSSAIITPNSVYLSSAFAPPSVMVTVEYMGKTATFEVAVAMLGDCNGDGQVNVTDLAALKLYLAGLGEVNQGADIDTDGEINTADLAELKLRLAGVK